MKSASLILHILMVGSVCFIPSSMQLQADIHNEDIHDEKQDTTAQPECTQKYNEHCNKPNDDESEMFRRGHLKPFGSHRPPDVIVEELKYMISPQDFYMNYVVKHIPVVLKGSVKHWPAYTKWTDEYLNKTYGNVSFLMETKNDDKQNIPPGMKLSEFLDSYQKVNRYLVDEVYPDMRKDVILPLALRCEEISSYFFVSYFWMSNGGTSSRIHIDTDENLLCVIHGHKSVILVSPEYSNYLYADDSLVLGVSDIDPQSVDMEKFPRVKNVRYQLANVEEGDIVYIPNMWWHQVVSRSERQQAIALWWKSKPFWREQGRTSIPNKAKEHIKDDPHRKYSYAKALEDYEQWVQDVSGGIPRIKCKSQESFMKDYHFETDKIPDAPVTRGDGGDLEEAMEAGENVQIKQGDSIDAKITPTRGCDFDRFNPKSPCHYKPCFEDDELLECVKYMLGYCDAFEDRGCVIQLPHVMNKKSKEELKQIKEMKGDFKK
ncbi:uncharacterized protein LOC116307162 [Actinia tenebrosa]|uniref:Uncharacterized protein LOC116307162 n=1 Tax=Actinia tenebrosa TaxID=6105 RepID=A0A6P8J5H2_ACTTE|nr:uncharacterized protein LOC116307162 [Actinia tenebrosa]